MDRRSRPLLIGREGDLQTISATLSTGSARIPWVLGGSGVGKTTLAHFIGNRAQRKFGWQVLRFSRRWNAELQSCSSLSGFLETAVEGLHGTTGDRQRSSLPDSIRDDFEGPLRKVLARATRARNLLLVLDGLDEVESDPEGKRDLISLCSAFSENPQAHLLATSRRETLLNTPEILLNIAGIEPHRLEGLPFEDFRRLARRLHLDWPEKETREIHRLVEGLPMAAIVLAELSHGASREAIGLLGTQDLTNPLFALHRAVLETKLAQLDSAADRDLVRDVLCLQAAARGRLRPEDLVLYLALPALTPHTLQRLLSRAQLDPLFFRSGQPEGPAGIALLHASFQEFLAGYFTAADLASAHRRIARALDPDTPPSTETPHLLHHLAQGWREDEPELVARLQALDWPAFLRIALREPSFLRADLLRDLEAVRKASPELLTQRLETSANRLLEKGQLPERELLLFLKLACNLARPPGSEPFLRALADQALRSAEPESRSVAIKKEELRGCLRSGSGPRPSLRLLVDLWPGYYPLFAVQKELQKKGIVLDIVESSTTKNQTLLARGADLIASTPGCILALPNESLRKLRVIGIPNRSAGADKILVDQRRIALTPGPEPRLERPSQLAGARLVATAESTSQMFLRLFLSEHGLDPSALRIKVHEEYLDVLEMVRDEEIDVISTWEPYASHLAENNENLKVVYDSSREPAVIYDLFITHQESFGAAREFDRLAALGRLYDDAVARDLAHRAEVVDAICDQFAMRREVYRQGLAGVQFFRREEMTSFFQPGNPENLRSICERVARIWRRPEQIDAEGNLREEFRQALDAFLGPGPPAWLVASPEGEETRPDFEYDVVLSYAGEDRAHAEALASRLQQLRYRVFYDQDHIAELWGRNLRQDLHEIYSRKARFCVIFASRHYLEKPWTQAELEAVQEREMEDREPGYLLPVDLDGSRLPGISRVRAYVSIQKGIDGIAGLLDQKLTPGPG